MDIAIKLTLVASVILIGYNLSQLLTSYESVCEKISKFKALAVETNSTEEELKLSNKILTGVLSLVYVVLTYFSGLALWVVATVAAKLVLTCFLSNREVVYVLKNEMLDKRFFMSSKVDTLTNILAGVGVLIILVA